MNEESISRYISETFSGVDVVVASRENGAPEAAWGDIFYIYDPQRNLPPNHRFPFATIVTKDYAGFDEASNLNRPGVFRLNIGVSKDRFRQIFRLAPTAPDTAATRDVNWDFTSLDLLMPHPVYAAQHWISILNPSEFKFAMLQPLLKEAYDIAVKRAANRGKSE